MEGLFDASRIFRTPGTTPALELVGERAIACVAEFEGRLPPVVSVAAFECRLAGDDDRVDYSVFIRDDPTVRGLLIGDAGGRHAALGHSSTWSSIREELARWASHCDERVAPAVWVEIDGPRAGSIDDAASPFVVYTLADSSSEDSETRILETRGLAQAALGLAHSDPLLRGLDGLTAALPPWCAVRHVAMRPQSGTRLLRAICRVPTTRASQFAHGGAASVAGRSIDALVSAVLDHSIVTNVNVDLCPEPGPRVGLEFCFTGTPQDDPRWGRLFDALQAMGLLCGSKRAALERWPSSIAVRDQPTRNDSRIVRDLLVKVDFDERQAIQAKAYLVFAPLLRTSASAPAPTIIEA